MKLILEKITTDKKDQKSIIFADAHVHIYECFEINNFLRSAFKNFDKVANQITLKNYNYSAILFLAETSQNNYFDFFNNLANKNIQPFPDLEITKTHEICSLTINASGNQKLYLIAGQQIVTDENLEVLGLATIRKIQDGKPIHNVIDQIIHTGGIPVIPWGVGKWIGYRGAVLKKLLTTHNFPYLFLGDNSGRPMFWSKPPLFQLAQKKGIKTLPGSDALPFNSESSRAGSFGFSVYGTVDAKAPIQSLKQILLQSEVEIKPYGLPETPFRFIKNQIAMQIVKHQKNHR